MGFTSFAEVDRLSVEEYELLMQAASLREEEAVYHAHLQAFLNVKAKAKKKAGKNKEKLVYSDFQKFYDRKKEIDRIMHPERKGMFDRYIRKKGGG